MENLHYLFLGLAGITLALVTVFDLFASINRNRKRSKGNTYLESKMNIIWIIDMLLTIFLIGALALLLGTSCGLVIRYFKPASVIEGIK